MSSTPLVKLRMRWAAYALLSMLAIALFYRLLACIQGGAYARQWLLVASAVILYQLVSLLRVLPQNHRQNEHQILPKFGPGNLMTMIRGTLIAMLSGFLLLTKLPGIWGWLPAALYILSDITDFLDGYLARVSDVVTRLGETLDMNYDALGVMVVTLLAFQYGTVPWWYLPFGFARYLFLLGMHFHQRAGNEVHPLRPSNTRRLFAGLQMGFITVMLFPVVGPPGTTFAATIFLFPFLSMFLIDYLQVTGHDPGRIWGDWNVKPLGIWLTKWAPLVLRGLIVLIYWKQAQTFGLTSQPKGGSMPEEARPIFLVLAILFMLLFALGILGRTSAILALISTGVQLQWLEFSFVYWLLVFALIFILFVGNGTFALWNPEEWLISNRAGQKKAA